jgi:hypothetical protein
MTGQLTRREKTSVDKNSPKPIVWPGRIPLTIRHIYLIPRYAERPVHRWVKRII